MTPENDSVEAEAISWPLKNFPAIWQAILLVLFWLFLQVVGSIFLTVLALFLKLITKSTWLFNLIMSYGTPIVTFTTFIPVALLVWFLTKEPINEWFKKGPFRYILLVPITITLFGGSIIESEMDNIFRYILPMPEFIQKIMKSVMIDPASSFLLIVIAAPLTEEILFRGIILKGFLTRYRRFTALIVSSVIFSFAHINPYQFCSSLFAGILLGWFYIETRSLWPCFFGHALHNLLCWFTYHDIFKIYIPGYTMPPEGMSASVFHPPWFDMMGILIFLTGIMMFYGMIKSRTGSPETPYSQVHGI